MTEVPWPWDLRRAGPAIELGKEAAKVTYDIDITFQYHTYAGQCPLEASVGMLSVIFLVEIGSLVYLMVD